VVESLPSWKNPDSIQMAIVAYFFKLSMAVRDLHSQLIEEYGVPAWGSYAIFAGGTLLLGSILGVVIVYFIDYLFPNKPPPAGAAASSLDKDGKKRNKKEKQKQNNNVKMVRMKRKRKKRIAMPRKVKIVKVTRNILKAKEKKKKKQMHIKEKETKSKSQTENRQLRRIKRRNRLRNIRFFRKIIYEFYFFVPRLVVFVCISNLLISSNRVIL